MILLQKDYIVRIKLSMLIQWQSKVVDPVDPSIPSFLYRFFYIIELVVALSIAEILFSGRYATINQSRLF